jgi:hypothetical protein
VPADQPRPASADDQFPFDTTRTVSDLLFSGTLQRADLQLIVPHGGGTLPMLAGRLWIAALGVMQSSISSADIPRALARLYYDLAAATAPGQFAALRALAPITQLLYGSDYPFTPEVAVAAGMAAIGADLTTASAPRSRATTRCVCSRDCATRPGPDPFSRSMASCARLQPRRSRCSAGRKREGCEYLQCVSQLLVACRSKASKPQRASRNR